MLVYALIIVILSAEGRPAAEVLGFTRDAASCEIAKAKVEQAAPGVIQPKELFGATCVPVKLGSFS